MKVLDPMYGWLTVRATRRLKSRRRNMFRAHIQHGKGCVVCEPEIRVANISDGVRGLALLSANKYTYPDTEFES